MDHKIGDKVKIREELKVGDNYGGELFTEDMVKFRGKEGIINNFVFLPNEYNLNFEGVLSIWNWTDEMFENIEE